MNYEIKLYAHGVPKGQGLWCVENLDSNYIDSFYGRKSNVPAHMLVEVRQFASSSNCYYTYFVGNTCDKDGRAGGYFALTLRINYYYADIRNIYNLLDAAFNKFIVGSIVTITNGSIRYLISDFSQADDNLKALELEINKYLMQFSSDSDFVSLNGFKANSQSETAQLNLLECEAKTVANHVKNHGVISVSPHYPSHREQQMVQKMTVEINEIKTSAQQQINAAKENAQRNIEAMRTQAQSEIEIAQHEKETGIQTIRNEYKEADKTISSLRKALENANKEIVRLKEKVNNCIMQIKNAEAYKTKFEQSQEEMKKANDLLQKIRESLSGLNGISEILGMNFASSKNSKANEDDPEQKKGINNLSFMKIIRGIHPFVDFFVMIILLCVIGFSFPKITMELQVANDRIMQLEKQLKGDNMKGEVDKPYKAGEGSGENNQSSFTEQFPNARIDIKEFTSSNSMMKYGNTYTVSLKNAEEVPGGKWVSNDFSIDDRKIKPNNTGKCKIFYVVNGEIVVTRTIIVDK